MWSKILHDRRSWRLRAALALLLPFVLLVLPPHAHAQERQPGDPCDTAGHFTRSGGPEVPGGGHFMVCDGTPGTWISVLDYVDDGRSLFQVGNDAGDCTALKTGRLRYDAGTWEYCDGTDWVSWPGQILDDIPPPLFDVLFLDGLADVNAPAPADGACLTWIQGTNEWQPGPCGNVGDLESVPDIPAPAFDVLFLNGLADVNVAAPADGECLTYVLGSNEWQPGTCGNLGDLESVSDIPAPDFDVLFLNGLADVNVATPADGQCLTYVLGSNEWQPGTCGGGGDLESLSDVPVPDFENLLVSLDDVDVSSPLNSQCLIWNSSTERWISGACSAAVEAIGTIPAPDFENVINALADVNVPAPADGACLVWVDAEGEWQADVCSGGGGESLWSLHANEEDIFYTTGNVGIGIDQPDAELHVIGQVRGDHLYFPMGDDTHNVGAVVFGNAWRINVSTNNGEFRVEDEGNAWLTGGRLGIGTDTPAATLDVGGTDALIAPRGTTAQRPGTPLAGMIRYNTSNDKFEVHQAAVWESLRFLNNPGACVNGDSITFNSATGGFSCGPPPELPEPPSFTVTRIQSASATGVPATAVFSQQPAEGNLLVAIAGHRFDAGPDSISGTGWVKHVQFDLFSGDSESRRGLAVWSKIAGADEPDTITVEVGASSASRMLIIQEFAIPAGMKATFITAASNQGGTSLVESITTGTTIVTPPDVLLVSALVIRGTVSPAWTNGLGSNISVSTTGSLHSAYTVHTQADQKESTASWSGAVKASAAIAVFAIEPDDGAPPPPPPGGEREIAFIDEGTWATDENFVFTEDGRVGIGTGAPDAALDVFSTDALIIPRGDSAQRPEAPAQGMLRYNATLHTFEGYVAGAVNDWRDLAVTGTPPAGADRQIQFNDDGSFGADTNLVYTATGQLGIGEQAPAARLHVGGEAIIGNTGLACSAATEGAMRYNTTEKVPEYCNGTNWTSVIPECSTFPDDFYFPDISAAGLGQTVESGIVQITGISCALGDTSITGDGSPQFRICTDSGCGTVVENWTATTTGIADGQYLQLRMTASSASLTIHTATVTIGGQNRNWRVTSEDAGEYKLLFIVTTDSGPGSGGALGGLSGADTLCQNTADANGLGGTFLAWLATDSTDDPATRFTKASVSYRRTDGVIIANNWEDLTDGSLLAHVNRRANGNSGHAAHIFTNVAPDGTAKYEGENNCNGWTSNGSDVDGHRGTNTSSGSAWTDSSVGNCTNSGTPYILCFQQ